MLWLRDRLADAGNCCSWRSEYPNEWSNRDLLWQQDQAGESGQTLLEARSGSRLPEGGAQAGVTSVDSSPEDRRLAEPDASDSQLPATVTFRDLRTELLINGPRESMRELSQSNIARLRVSPHR